jgi:Glyoxalase-like domain
MRPRLGLELSAGSRTTPGGDVLRWRLAGLAQTAAEPCLPFFIEWAEGTPFPGRAARHQELFSVELAGSPERIADWLGDHQLPTSVAPGAPAVRSIVLTSSTGEEVVLDG